MYPAARIAAVPGGGSVAGTPTSLVPERRSPMAKSKAGVTPLERLRDAVMAAGASRYPLFSRDRSSSHVFNH